MTHAPPQPDPDEAALARDWIAAAGEPTIARELEAIYARVGEQIAQRGPACWASGRCCNFRTTGHLLYVTGLEAAYCVLRARVIRADRAPGALPQLAPLGLPSIDAARARGDCPFLVDNACGVHSIKPLGCRVYFCDRSAQDWQHQLSEAALADIRALHQRHGLEYRYAEWRDQLALLARAQPPQG